MNLGYVISTIIASLVLLSLVALNSRIMRGSGEQTLYTMAKIQSDMIVDYVNDDMRTMGYRIEGIDGNAIIDAETNRIRFQARPNDSNDNIVIIEWEFDADPSATPSGRNPNVRPLYRSISFPDDPAASPITEQIGSGVVDFSLVYLNESRQPILSDPVSNPGEIRHIQLNILVESLDSYNPDRFERSTWRGDITPFNLRPN